MADETPSIHVLMARVMADIGPIGKTGWNEQQRFRFRGIDAVADAVNVALVKHGVFFLPEVIERERRDYVTKKGTEMEGVHLHVKYTFYGPAGDSVSGSMWGEAADSGDKATSKAASMAEKYLLLQAFCVSSEDQEDADSTSHERGRNPADEVREQIKTAAKAAGKSLADVATEFESDYGEDIRSAGTENLRRYLAEITEIPAPADAPPPPANPPAGEGEPGSKTEQPAKTADEWRSEVLSAPTKKTLHDVMRRMSMAGVSDHETADEQGAATTLMALAAARAKELP